MCPLGSLVSEPSLNAGSRPSSLPDCTWNPTTGVLSSLYFAWSGVPTSSDWYLWHSIQVSQQQSVYHRNDNAHSTAYRRQKRDSWRRAHQPSLRDQQCTWWTTADRVLNLVAQSTWREQYTTYYRYKRLEIFCHIDTTGTTSTQCHASRTDARVSVTWGRAPRCQKLLWGQGRIRPLHQRPAATRRIPLWQPFRYYDTDGGWLSYRHQRVVV